MMEGEAERNYGATVTKETYEWGLQIHQYIPQADQGIRDEIELFAQKRGPIRVLDLGCGPGRLTKSVADLENVEVEGLDASPEFIQAAQREDKNTHYIENDFLAYDSARKYDIIFMQGVFHHIHGKARMQWIQKISALLAPGGRFIVGDEFIPEYEDGNETERRTKAGLFYLHIIGESQKAGAQKGGMNLAEEECINFIADTLSGEEACGYYDDKTLARIQETARTINERLFRLDDARIRTQEAYETTNALIAWVRSRAHTLKDAGFEKRIDRGDYKVSTAVLKKEFSPYFTSVENRERKFGPVDEIGGMGVLVFEKPKLPQ